MKKKILFIQQNLQGGGAEKVLIDILDHFDYNLYDVTLLLSEKSGVYLDSVNKNVEVLILFNKEEQFILGYLRQFRFLSTADCYSKIRLNIKLRNRHFDTIVSFMEGISHKLHGYIVNKAKKNVSWVHIDMVLNNWYSNVYKNLEEQSAIYDSMDEIAVVSDGAKASFLKLFPNTTPRVVYNLIDKKQIIEKSLINRYVSSKFTICNVGRLANQKRQDRIIDVAELCKKEGLDIDFLIIGTGPLDIELRRTIAEKKLEDSVHLMGFQRNPYSYMGGSDLFLLSSDSEGYPLVVCEAICLGLPIISTDVTGPHELLKDGTGILTESNPSDIFTEIKKLYTDREALKKFSQNALLKSEMFEIEKQMDVIYSVIN